MKMRRDCRDRSVQAIALTLVALAVLSASLTPPEALPIVRAEQPHTVYLPVTLQNYLPEPGPSSEDLIDRALAEGDLDAETALVYKVYALFGDSRLPGQYGGDDRYVDDTWVLVEVASRWDTLSSQTQAILAPFLLPPTAPGSWEAQAVGNAGDLGAAQGEEWQWFDAAGLVKVWYNPGYAFDAAKARGLKTAIEDRIYPSLLTAMNGRKWMSDAGETNDGGDGRLDVYLVSQLHAPGATRPYRGCPQSPVLILLRDTLPLGDETNFGLLHVLSHEMMHAVQLSYDWKDGCDSYRWLAEATAHWFVDYVYPNVNREHHAAGRFLGTPSLSLEDRSSRREYGAYLLPFYLTHTGSPVGVVGTIWENAGSYSSLEAVNQVLSGGFDSTWPDFVRRNWNRPPETDYHDWDKLAYGLTPYVPVAVAPGEQPLPVELPHLSAKYYRFTFPDDNVRSVIFFNGLSWTLSKDEIPGLPGSETYLATAPADFSGIGVQALIKVQGQDWTHEDWTYLASRGFCRDAKAERLEELVILFSNSEYRSGTTNYDLKPTGLDSVLLASDMGCWQWKGTVTATVPHANCPTSPKPIETYQVNATFERNADAQPSFSVPYHLKEGSFQWSIAGKCVIGGLTYTYSGSKSVTLTEQDGDLATYNGMISGPHHRGYYGLGLTDAELPVTFTGPLGPGTYTWPGGIWLTTGLHPLDDPRQLISGTTMAGTYTWPVNGATYQWNLQAQREP